MKDFLKRNSSTILTCVGAAGVVVTTVMAVKATPKALTLLEKAKEEKGDELSKLEMVKIAGPTYIPTVISGVATIACIFGSNIISKHQQATLMSAYALIDNSFKEYREKVDELYGEDAGKEVRAEIAKDKYTGDEVSGEDGKELFYDFFSGRYFESTREGVMMAVYEINRSMMVNCCAGLNDFYNYLGLQQRTEYDELGWTIGLLEEMYWHPWIEFDFEETTIDDDSDEHEGLKCTIIHMPMEPFMGYLDY
jgi:hypothetical protein